MITPTQFFLGIMTIALAIEWNAHYIKGDTRLFPVLILFGTGLAFGYSIFN